MSKLNGRVIRILDPSDEQAGVVTLQMDVEASNRLVVVGMDVLGISSGETDGVKVGDRYWAEFGKFGPMPEPEPAEKGQVKS